MRTIPTNDLLPSSYNGVVAEDTVVVPGITVHTTLVTLVPRFDRRQFPQSLVLSSLGRPISSMVYGRLGRYALTAQATDEALGA